MAAGTLLQHFHTLHTSYALTCSNWCGADTSGEVPHTSHLSRLSALARSDGSPATGLREPAHRSHRACSTHARKPYPWFPVRDKRPFPAPTLPAPNRSKRDNCCSIRISPALVPTPPWWRLKIGCPMVYSKTQCYNIEQRAHLKQSRLGYSLEIAHANTDQAELSPGLGLARNKSLGHLKDHRFAAYRTCQRHLASKRCEIGEP